jgi:nucleoside-diphosphate-sugar epimerase
MRVFVTGVTGYIGGSVAEGLLTKGHKVTGLVRSTEKAIQVAERGITPILGSLESDDILASAALEADAVIHTASADHPNSVITLVSALERTGKTLITTSGTGIAADSAGGEFAGSIVISDDTYFEPVPFRRPRVSMNQFVRHAAIDKGVRSIVICPSMVYGKGLGLQTDSDQIPKLMAVSKQVGAGVYFGKGLNRYSNVFIEDLVDLYLLALDKAPGGSFFFAENGHSSFKEIAELISEALGFGGKTISLPVEEVVQQAGEAGRYGITSNSLVHAVNARRLGWDPHGPSLLEWFKRSH